MTSGLGTEIMATEGRHRILIVDDDGDGRAAMSEWLERRGFEAIAVGDGEEALQHIHDGVEVIVADLKMPRIDGLQLLRATKEECPHAAVILVSGYATVSMDESISTNETVSALINGSVSVSVTGTGSTSP